jgi:hypothetical protein
MTALLEQPAIPRVLLLEAFQSGQGLGYPVQVSLIDSHQVKDFAALGRRDRECFGRGQRFAVLSPLGQLPDTAYLELDRCRPEHVGSDPGLQFCDRRIHNVIL